MYKYLVLEIPNSREVTDFEVVTSELAPADFCNDLLIKSQDKQRAELQNDPDDLEELEAYLEEFSGVDETDDGFEVWIHEEGRYNVYVLA